MLKRYNGGLSDIQLKRLDKIMYNTHHLMDIIQEVVASNPYDITVEAEDPEHIDMTAFIPHMINAVTDGERIQHTLDIQSGSQTVYWDRNNLERLMGHLLMNALKYSEDDVLLTVELQSNEMVIRLEDSGMGIPDEAKDHIFELFYRAENVETISGIGLGLNIAKRVVNLHDGKIDIESTLDEGTTVTVTLPRYLMKQR
jgi:signal transduction histidine kinase